MMGGRSQPTGVTGGDAGDGGGEPQPQYPSLDLVYELTKARATRQDTQINTLDGKANFTFAAGTILTAVTGAIQKEYVTTAPDIVPYTLVASLVIYIGIVFCAYKAYEPRSYMAITDIGPIRDEFAVQPAETTTLRVINTMLGNIAANDTLINDKAKWVKWLLYLIALEALIITGLAILQIFYHVPGGKG